MRVAALLISVLIVAGCRSDHPGECLPEALALEKAGQHQQAIHLLDACEGNDSTRITMLVLKGRNLAALNRHREAVKVYRQALNENPASVSGDFYMAFSLHHLDENDSAVSYYTRALESGKGPETDSLAPSAAAIRYHRALVYFELGKDSMALEDFAAAAHKGYQVANTLFYSGLIFMKSGKTKEGCARLRSAAMLGQKQAEEYYGRYCTSESI